MGAEASFVSPSGGTRVIQPSVSLGLSVSNDLKNMFRTLKRCEREVYAIFPCIQEDAHLTAARARCAAKKMREGHIDNILIIGNKLLVKLPLHIFEAEGIPYNRMKIINESNNLIETMSFGLGHIRDDIRDGKKIDTIKVLAPESKSEEIMQIYRYIKRMPENEKLNGVPIQLLRVKEKISDARRVVDKISLYINPIRFEFALLGKTMANFLSRP